MNAHATSNAHFLERARECAVPEELLDKLDQAGIRSLSHLAFAVARPGQEFDERRFEEFLTRVNNGTAPSIGAIASVRMLHFEAEIVVTSSLRSSVEQPASESNQPKPVPHAERTARMDQLRRALAGLSIEGVHEPSQALVDECVHQFDTKTLRYIAPAKCNSRESEIMSGRTDKKLKIESNTLAVKETKTTPEEDISTAYKLHQCLRRRGLAYQFSGLITHSAHERYVDRLMTRLSVTPPPGYLATTLNQILRTDQEVFCWLSQNVPDIRPAADNSKPLDKGLEAAMLAYEVMFHLLPLPQSAPQSAYGPVRHAPEPPQEYQDRSYPSFRKGKSKGKSKSKSKGAGSIVAPRGMKGCVGRDPKGRAICFGFNFGTCNEAAVGAACSKGRHICFKAGCHKNHAFCVAHADDMPKKADE